MAEVYVDLDLATGGDDGTTWADAYQSLVTALNGTNSVSGDNVWVLGGTSEAVTSSTTLTGGQTVGHPVRVIGVKAGTTAEPPVASDILPGWRTGDGTHVEADLAYNDGNIPTFEIDSTSADLSISRWFYIYGVNFISGDDIRIGIGTEDNKIELEECLLEYDVLFFGNSGSGGAQVLLKNCHQVLQTASQGLSINDNGIAKVVGGKITRAAGAHDGIVQRCHKLSFRGIDLSDQAHTLMFTDNLDDGELVLENCKLNASTAFITGAVLGQQYRLEAYGCSSTTGKTTGGSFLEFDVVANTGVITQETTVVRTGGADDGGDGAYALAFTPNIDGTRDATLGLIGPWTDFYLEGDGTAQTVNLFICNSAAEAGGNLLQDDEVAMELEYMSPLGDALYDNETTLVDLEATPSNVTTDGSTWGTGGNNKQVLSKAVSPDYTGMVRVRMVVYKHYSSSPVTTYQDPLPTVT